MDAWKSAIVQSRACNQFRRVLLPSHDLHTVIRIAFPHDERLGHGKMALLEHIKATGSISAGGRAMDMSYRRAWQLVSAMNQMFATPVVVPQRGGKQGGGALVTPFGEELLARFRSMQAKVDSTLANDLEWLNTHRAPQPSETSAPPF